MCARLQSFLARRRGQAEEMISSQLGQRKNIAHHSSTTGVWWLLFCSI